MEGLKKLENLQRIMELMKSHGIIDFSNNDDPETHLFLANFTVFLVQSCSKLGMEPKRRLISEYMSKCSTSFLDEALQCAGEEGDKEISYPFSRPCDNKPGTVPSKRNFQEAATVGQEAMQRANSTLEDFLDTLNEKLLQSPVQEVQFGEREYNRNCIAEQRWQVRSLEVLRTDPFRPLVTLLEHERLLTERLREELRSGVEYWALERKLCCPSLSTNQITMEDVTRAVRMKSFDYRVLNLLLYQLRREELF